MAINAEKKVRQDKDREQVRDKIFDVIAYEFHGTRLTPDTMRLAVARNLILKIEIMEPK